MSLAALCAATRDSGRVIALGYLLIAVTLNVAWETGQLPLYTIWQTGSAGALAFVILHCTGGDLLILAASLMLALLLIGDANWPRFGYRWVVLATTILGLSYTVQRMAECGGPPKLGLRAGNAADPTAGHRPRAVAAVAHHSADGAGLCEAS